MFRFTLFGDFHSIFKGKTEWTIKLIDGIEGLTQLGCDILRCGRTGEERERGATTGIHEVIGFGIESACIRTDAVKVRDNAAIRADDLEFFVNLNAAGSRQHTAECPTRIPR